MSGPLPTTMAPQGGCNPLDYVNRIAGAGLKQVQKQVTIWVAVVITG